jgi:hypothetical protein
MEFQHPLRAQRLAAAPMGQYRLYFMDSIDRLIARSHEFEAVDDESAIRMAEELREGRPVELWRGSHRLKSWE